MKISGLMQCKLTGAGAVRSSVSNRGVGQGFPVRGDAPAAGGGSTSAGALHGRIAAIRAAARHVGRPQPALSAERVP